VLLTDLCHATSIENTKPLGIGSVVEKLGQAPGEMLGLMASRQGVSMEGTQFGGGHGAFAFSVLKGLEGAADQNKTNAVTAGALRDYIRTDVSAETGNKQHPRDFGGMANETKVVDVSKAGINISRFKSLYDSRTGEPLFLAQNAGAPQISAEAQRDIDTFQAAVRAKHLLPTDAGNPWPLVDKMRAEMSPEVMFQQENSLRVALEDQAQQVLLRYLAGDQNPQTKSEFDAGSQYMEAAMRLTPESLYLQGRDSFFLGRALLFEKQFGRAADLLEASVRIDPGEAYGYNALGIAYLEQADFAKAIPAFRDAAHRAPNWSYPLHNLALAYVEAGQAEEAIRSYQQAMKVTPQFGYLPYNLGLIYQRLNRRKEAEDSYRKAASLSPASAEPLNALGTLKSAEGKSAEAEKLYRSALEKNPNLLPARHNLGVLLSSNKDRQPEAIELWKQNLTASADYLPSRLALAELLAKRDDAAGAIDQYRIVIAQTPDYLGARVALAAQLIKAKQPEAALEQLRIAVKVQDKNPQLWEQIGDAEKALNHTAESRDAYAAALKLETENADRKRLRTKMAF
jgi:tetratricopeptide (TPR) repeat protein